MMLFVKVQWCPRSETVQKIHVPHNSATPESYFLSDEPVLSIDNEDRGKGCSSQAGI